MLGLIGMGKSLLIELFLLLAGHIPGYLGKKKKANYTKLLLSKEISVNQRKLEHLRDKVDEGLQKRKSSSQSQKDFPRPKVTTSFETKTYQGLAPFEVLSDECIEDLELYYHKLSKLEEAWNGFVEGEPRGPEITPKPAPITKARGHALAIKAVTVRAIDIGKELLLGLKDQNTDTDEEDG